MSFSDRMFSGGRSNFSQTCSLLSHYLKEKGNFGDLTLGLTPSAEPQGAMELLPKMEKSGQAPEMNLISKFAFAGEENVSCSTGQMTIFYGGQVFVFNDLPKDKAMEILMFAKKCSAANNHQSIAFPAPSPAESATGTPNVFNSFSLSGGRHPQPAIATNLPIARRNSLARFLEKRKDRITSNAPYQASKPAAAPKPAKGEPALLSSPRSINQHLNSSFS